MLVFVSEVDLREIRQVDVRYGMRRDEQHFVSPFL